MSPERSRARRQPGTSTFEDPSPPFRPSGFPLFFLVARRRGPSGIYARGAGCLAPAIRAGCDLQEDGVEFDFRRALGSILGPGKAVFEAKTVLTSLVVYTSFDFSGQEVEEKRNP